jgi:8-oxo-dGTP diphosphatase
MVAKTLLVKRGEDPDKDWWDIPGGYLDWDETLEECASRELKEETNLFARPDSFQLFDFRSDPNNKAKNQVVDVYFISRDFSGDIKIDGNEVVDYRWFELANLPDNIAFYHGEILKKLKN